MWDAITAAFLMAAFWLGVIVGRVTRPRISPIRDRVSVVKPTVFYEHPGFRDELEKHIASKLRN